MCGVSHVQLARELSKVGGIDAAGVRHSAVQSMHSFLEPVKNIKSFEKVDPTPSLGHLYPPF
jgi:hypothetical protein